MQIDWVSGHIKPRPEVYRGGRIWEGAKFVRVSSDGEVLAETSALTPAMGSHDTSIQWGTQTGEELYMTGNPVKFLQGHNLFGSSDPLALFVAAGAHCRQSGAAPFPGITTWGAYDFDFTPTRLDITRSYRFGSEREALEWIYHVGASAHSGRHKKDHQSSTVYFGKKSRRWAMKIYAKLQEISSKAKGHKLSKHLTSRQKRQLVEWAEGVVRFEITLRSMELSATPKALLTPDNLPAIWNRYHDRIQYNRNAEAFMTDMTTQELKPVERLVLEAWKGGADIRAIHSKSAFYRYRKLLLDVVGVDISEAPPEKLSPVRAELDPKGWDPEPIRELMYDPEPVAVQYPLRRWNA